MMTINANTKIAAILKQHPDALEAIVSLDSKFEKLRNPIIRKLMAGRASIAMASKISGVSMQTFFEKLSCLGFKIDAFSLPVEEGEKELPDFMLSLKTAQIIELDVRPEIAAGKDPLSIITEKVKTVKVGGVLKIINIFEPVPLMKLLERQGFQVYADVISDDLVETYFYKQDNTGNAIIASSPDATKGWDEALKQFGDRITKVDVRTMEMPLPMHTILEALDTLAADTALFVYHKRIPVFLLPELTERQFDYRIREVSDGEVHLLIFKA